MGRAPNRFCVLIIALVVGSAATSVAQCPETGVNLSEYGTPGWNGYLYDGVNAFDPSNFWGTLAQPQTFNETFSDLLTDGGCAYIDETFSVRFKSRQSFACGLHTFTIGSDYGVRFSIDGGNTFPINIASGTGYITTDYTVHLTGGTYDLVIEYFHTTGTPRVTFSYSVASGSGDFAGEISGDQTICDNPADPAAFTSLSVARFCSELPASYQWEVNIDGGGYNPITGATALVFDPPSGLAAGSYLYRRKATAGLVTIVSNEISVVVDVPQGNETSFGTGQWFAYAYEGADNYASGSYLGSFVEPVDFTEDFSAIVVDGCDLPVENFSVRFKRQEVIAACGGYNFTIEAGGGGARLYVDGALVIDGYAPIAPLTAYSANLFLSAGNHQFILEYYNNVGANGVSFEMTSTGDPGGGGVIGPDQAACGSSYNPVAFIDIEGADFCSGTFIYQWQSSPDGNDPWTNIPGAESATYDETSLLSPGTYYYRRAATDVITVYSNTVLVEVKEPIGDVSEYPSGSWRGYVYNGANNFSLPNYLGYFDDAALNLAQDFSAITMTGCDIPEENFSVRLRREETMACGGYDIVITGDDLVRFYLDDVELTNGFTSNYSGNVYLDGDHRFAIEYYVATGTKNVSFTITATGQDRSGGLIGYSQDICDATRNPAEFQSLVDAGYCAAPGGTYVWEQATSPSGPWTDLGVATSTYNPPVLAPDVYYYRRGYSDGVIPIVYSNVLEVSAFTPENPPAEFGSNEWYGYVYDNENDFTTNYKGYITQPTNFDESFCAGQCEFPTNGCFVEATEFSVLFKNKVDFECGSYLITVGGDDGVRLIVDGVTVPEFDKLTPHSYTTYSKVMYFDGTAPTELELYYFESAGGNRVSFSAVFLGPGDAGVVAGDQYSCTPGMDPAAFTSTEPATACPTFPAPTYQWQESLNGLGWNDISGATTATYDPGPLSITHYYRRQATIDGHTLNSNVLTVEIDPPQGDQMTYGQNQWIGYVYDFDEDEYPTSLATLDYHGYMIENTNFDRSFCGSYCTQAINGCNIYMEGVVINYLNEMTLECGYYRITIGFNDGGRLSIDGTVVSGLSEFWTHSPYHVLEETVFLSGGTHQFRYEYLEHVDGNRVSFNMEFLGAGTPALIGNHQVLCSGADDPAPIVQFDAPDFECSPDATPDYQWQISTDEINWSDIPLANAISYDPPAGHTFTAHYRRKDTNDIGDELISDVVTVSYSSDSPPFDGSEFGTAPEWIGHVYNGSNLFSDYQGSYIETMAPNAFDQSFCGPNCIFPLDGCDIVTNTFTVQYKTQIDLVAGDYTFTIGSEGAARLFISGEEIATPTLIIDDYALHYPYRTRSNNTPLANGTPLELQGGTYFLVLDYFEDYNDNRISFSYIFTPLPVTWHYFNGYYADDKAHIEWRTASEINNSGFEVERSNDGANFTNIGWVEGNGSTTVEQQYLFTDENPEPGWNYYRLKQIDYDGKSEYSRLIPVFVDDLPQVEIYPNPFRDHLYLSRINTEHPPEVTLTNILGQRSWVLVQDAMQPARFNLPTRLEPGVYSARIRVGDATYTRKVIIE